MYTVNGEELVRAVHRAALVGGTMLDQVPDIPEGEPFAVEWRAFKREVCRLVNEEQTGKFAVVKGDQVVNVWDTANDAHQAGLIQFGEEPFLVQEVQLFLRYTRWGYRRLCRD